MFKKITGKIEKMSEVQYTKHSKLGNIDEQWEAKNRKGDMNDKLDKIIELLEMLIAAVSEPVNCPSVWVGKDIPQTITTTTTPGMDTTSGYPYQSITLTK